MCTPRCAYEAATRSGSTFGRLTLLPALINLGSSHAISIQYYEQKASGIRGMWVTSKVAVSFCCLTRAAPRYLPSASHPTLTNAAF